jgi:putative DNA primase/helicase
MNAAGKVRESMQQNLLAVVAFDDEHGQQVVDTVPVELFEGDYGRLAEQIYDYWREQRRAPGLSHLVDLIEEIRVVGDSHRELLHNIKFDMLLLYESPSWNIKYVFGNLERFMTEQRQKMTIMAAAEAVNARADPSEVAAIFARGATVGGDVTAAPATPALITGDELVRQPLVDWYDKPFLPWSCLSVIAGEKTIGKTTFAADLAAGLSTDEHPMATLYISKETSAEAFSAVVEAQGGDRRWLRFYGGRSGDTTTVTPPSRLTPAWFTTLEELLVKSREAGTPVGLIVIDPLNSFIDSKLINSDAGVRETLDPLAQLAAKHRLMVVATTHFTKNREAPLRDRILGSVGVINVARSINVLLRDPDDGGDRRLLINLMGNFAEAGVDNVVGYRLKRQQRGFRLAFERDLSSLSEPDADGLAARRNGRPGKSAEKMLAEWLKDGPLTVDEVEALASEAGISWISIKRAKSKLGVSSQKEGGRGTGWRWSLER